MHYDGMGFVPSGVMVINVPKRKHKKKRIQKKWIKRYGYKTIPDPKLYVYDGKIIAHPDTVERVVKILKNK